jgi:hypothetical protein
MCKGCLSIFEFGVCSHYPFGVSGVRSIK